MKEVPLRKTFYPCGSRCLFSRVRKTNAEDAGIPANYANKKPGAVNRPRLYLAFSWFNQAYSAADLDLRNFGSTTHRANKAVKPTNASANSMMFLSPIPYARNSMGRRSVKKW